MYGTDEHYPMEKAEVTGGKKITSMKGNKSVQHARTEGFAPWGNG